MRKRIRVSLWWLLLGAALAHGADDAGFNKTEILARAYVPNRLVPQGEVRLVRRNGDPIVQTVLHTGFGKVVLSRITENERGNWGDQQDAANYIGALQDAFSEYENRRLKQGRQTALVIEFIDGPDSARVEFRFSPVSRERSGFDIHPSPAWRIVPVSRDYLRRNQEFILVDAFKDGAAKPLDLLHRFRSDQGGAPS